MNHEKTKKPVLVVLCPIGKFVFSHEDALRFKALIIERFDRLGIQYVNLDGVIPDGVIRDQKHIEPAVRHFQERRIDALFIPHCNFGTEGAAGMIARGCGVPTLLWGPRDEAPLADGSRLRDSPAQPSLPGPGHRRLAAIASRIRLFNPSDPR